MSSLRPMITEFDIWRGGFIENPAPNFSYYEIPAGCCLKIYQYQQMITHDTLYLYGDIHVEGELIIIN